MLRCFLFFCLSPLIFLFPKNPSPVAVLVWLISYPHQRGGESKSNSCWQIRSGAGRLLRASPVASSSLTSLCEELAERRARATSQGSARGPRSQRTRATGSPTSQPPLGGGKAASRAHRPAPSAPLPAAWLDSASPSGIRSEGTQRLGEQQGRWAKLAPSSEWRRLGWGSVTLAPGSSESCLFQWVCAQVPAWAAGNGFGDVNK